MSTTRTWVTRQFQLISFSVRLQMFESYQLNHAWEIILVNFILCNYIIINSIIFCLLFQLLEYTGRGKSITDVGLAQARYPLDTTNHYFEIEITDPGDNCYIAIGLARKVICRHHIDLIQPTWTGDLVYKIKSRIHNQSNCQQLCQLM